MYSKALRLSSSYTVIIAAAFLLISTLFPANYLSEQQQYLNAYGYAQKVPAAWMVPFFFAAAVLASIFRNRFAKPLSVASMLIGVLALAVVSDANTPDEPNVYMAVQVLTSLGVMIGATGYLGIKLYKLSQLSPVKKASGARNAKKSQMLKLSPLKFATLSLSTYGLYNVYWIYRNWQAREIGGKKPLVNAAKMLVAYFYPSALLENLNVRNASLLSGLYTFLWIITQQLPGAWQMLGFLSFLPLLPAQQNVNALSPEQPISRKLSAKETAVVIIGGILIALVLVASW
jgi:hypothetical protein